MRCEEIQTLQGTYLDSELDARTALEIQQHLKSCAECARLFAEGQRLEARMKAGLNRGERTDALWEKIEQGVAAAAVADSRDRIGGGRAIHASPLTPALSPSEGERVPFRAGEGQIGGLANSHVSRGPGLLTAFGEQLRAGWRRSRWAWAGLAAVWAVILGLDFTAREQETTLVAGQGVPSVSEMRLAWEQKERLMAELAITAEPAPADKPKPAPPRPRSEGRNETLNA